MSKERLQKIKVKVAEIDTNFVVGNHKEAYQGLYELEGQYHIDWLIQQAEEKIQLEEQHKKLHEYCNHLEIKNQRYKQALEFYALKGNYRYSPIDDDIPPVNVDGGEKARKALQGGNDNE